MTDLLDQHERDDATRAAHAARTEDSRSTATAASVMFYRCHPETPRHDHDLQTKAEVARAIAGLLGGAYLGDYGEADVDQACAARGDRPGAGTPYVVPSHTLVGSHAARKLGIRELRDFFGGVVPHRFVATKAITHALVRPGTSAPDGWSHDHAELIRNVVLPGYTAFSVADAASAANMLLERGAVRLKHAEAVGGAGQAIVANRREFEAYLAALDGDLSEGLILELDLAEATTCSIGHVQVGDRLASYVGTQYQTTNGRGHTVYGGSDLRVVRGRFESLLGLDLEPALRIAVAQALYYHVAAAACYPGLIASRSNYDVVQGLDGQGRWRSGVLEQSWRIGGASGAEIAALRALRDDPALSMVQASTRELYGARADDRSAVPDGAWVHFDGVDRHGERLVKYVEVRPDVHPGVRADAQIHSGGSYA